MELAELLGDTAGGRHPRVDEAELVHRTDLSLALGVSELDARIHQARPWDQGRAAPFGGPQDAHATHRPARCRAAAGYSAVPQGSTAEYRSELRT
jgi:hypothetical protein